MVERREEETCQRGDPKGRRRRRRRGTSNQGGRAVVRLEKFKETYLKKFILKKNIDLRIKKGETKPGLDSS